MTVTRDLPAKLKLEDGRMNPKLAELWAVTLESGNYKQCRGKLRDRNNQCCCLGVLGDIVQPNGWSQNSPNGVWCLSDNYDVLSPAIRNAVGMSSDEQQRFVQTNDSDGENFNKIAALVRKTYCTGR